MPTYEPRGADTAAAETAAAAKTTAAAETGGSSGQDGRRRPRQAAAAKTGGGSQDGRRQPRRAAAAKTGGGSRDGRRQPRRAAAEMGAAAGSVDRTDRLACSRQGTRSWVGGASDPGSWHSDPAGGTVLAILQVVRPGRAVGEHDRQPGRAFLRPGRLGRAWPGAQAARTAGPGRPAGARGHYRDRLRASLSAAQPAGRGQPPRRAADGRDRSASCRPPPDQAQPGGQGAATGGEATPVGAEEAAPVPGRLTAAVLHRYVPKLPGDSQGGRGGPVWRGWSLATGLAADPPPA